MGIKNLLGFIMSDLCYKKYFVEFDFLNVPCFKAVLSKVLGYGIVLGAVLVKVPQIQKVVAGRSGAGISFLGLLFEIYAMTSMFVYSLAKNYPFSSYGDAFFLLLQNAILGFLIQFYKGKSFAGVLFLLILTSIVFILTSGFTPITILTTLQASNLPAIIISKFMQAWNNYQNGSTGQLSAITIFLVFAGSLSRIFTSIQETGDQLIIFNYVVSTFFNGVVAFQMIYYWNVTPKKKID